MRTTSYDAVLDYLVERLDLVIREQVGQSLADTMQRIRRLAIERRAGLPDAETRLVEALRQLEPDDLRSVIRWLSIFFDLANVVEECQRIEVLRRREYQAKHDGVARGESVASAVEDLKNQGLSAAEIQSWLNRLKIEPVFTAHPSEAKRRTTRQLLRQIRQLVPRIAGVESDLVESELLAILTVLWQSDFVRPDRPPVMSEVSRGVYFAWTLWNVVPQIFRELRSALKIAYPEHQFEVPGYLSFGSWIGGDRDGHPFVTAEISRKTLSRLRRAALEAHLKECRRLFSQVVMSDRQVASDTALRHRLEQSCQQWPQLEQRLAPLSQSETYRRYLRMLEFRLENTLATNRGEKCTAAFGSARDFQNDLAALRESMLANRGERVVKQHIQPWIDLAKTFGFHFASLDIRQNSEAHRQCLNEVVDLQSATPDSMSEEERIAFISQTEGAAPVDLSLLSDASREMVDTFLLIAEQFEADNAEAIGGYVISMTHSAVDVLAVLWLWRTAWAQAGHSADNLPHLPIIPLFETIDDLRGASTILSELFKSDTYRRYLAGAANPHQMVMVGYSDSTKDGGYLTACWELHQSQSRLADVAEQHHIGLTVFHGRGGSLGRGGGPAARAILSLPQKSVGGRLRVTEQGEVLSERYDDAAIAHRHLEQIVNATLRVSAIPSDPPQPAWVETMEQLSEDSLDAYRQLVEHDGFLDYFRSATPISEIETLPIGSRPSRRTQRNSLADLRAIPWTFAWTQCRHFLPAWYGFGMAVRKVVDASEGEWETLREMYHQWPMFSALIDNAELALAKSDMQIARHYAMLASGDAGNAVWQMIAEEFEMSRGAVLMIKENRDVLAQVEWLRSSVSKRNPYVDPLNLSQIEILKRLRAAEGTDSDALVELARLSIQGIAGGLRTTG